MDSKRVLSLRSWAQFNQLRSFGRVTDAGEVRMGPAHDASEVRRRLARRRRDAPAADLEPALEVIAHGSTNLPIVGDGADAQSGGDAIDSPGSTVRVLHYLVQQILGPDVDVPLMLGGAHSEGHIDLRIAREPDCRLRKVRLVVRVRVDTDVLLQAAEMEIVIGNEAHAGLRQ